MLLHIKTLNANSASIRDRKPGEVWIYEDGKYHIYDYTRKEFSAVKRKILEAFEFRNNGCCNRKLKITGQYPFYTLG